MSRSPNGQVRSLTFDDLGLLFRFLHVSRLLFGGEFEFNNHLNIYEVALGSSQHIKRLLEAVDTSYEYPAGPLAVDLT